MEPRDEQPPQTFSLRGRPGAIVLEEEGLHHPKTPRGRGVAFTRYEDITHIATSPRALWLGTRRSVYVLARRGFTGSDGPEHLVRALLERIAMRPEGSAQLARMAQIEEVARAPGSLYATWGLSVICGVVFLLQLFGGDDVQSVGQYSSTLVADGDWWRLFTANLLHAYPYFPIHLVMNLLGLLALGSLVERAIGTPRMLCVMGVSGLGAMLASGIAHSPPVVGVSGVVFGILGALTWLEFRCAAELPAWWRVPRRALLWMLVLSAGLPLLVPIIAGAAHLGGFLAGGAVAALLVGRPFGRLENPAWLRATAGAVVAVTALSVSMAGYELLRPGEYAARHLARLGRLPDLTPDELNNEAWLVAIDPDSSPQLLEAALGLAERAAADTQRQEPNILDTIAELHFQLGDRDAALAAIEEAIAQSPGVDYFREQRRRFLGERDPDDRPPPPMPWDTPQPDEPGVHV